MISIIDDLSQVTTGRFECVISGNGIEELMDSATANMALRKAAELGLHRPGVSNAGGAYPVDAEGRSDDAVMLGQRPVAGYRRDFVILASL